MAVKRNILLPQDIWNEPDWRWRLAWTALGCVEKGQYSWRAIKHLEFLHPWVLSQTAPAERILPVHLFQFSVTWSFLVSVPSLTKSCMEGGSVDFRWGGRSAAGSGTAVCCWRKAAGLPSALTCASVLVHLEKTLSINHCPAWGKLGSDCCTIVLVSSSQQCLASHVLHKSCPKVQPKQTNKKGQNKHKSL